MSKFLNLVSKYNFLLEADEQVDPNAAATPADPNVANDPSLSEDPNAAAGTTTGDEQGKTPSELPIINNDQIAQMVLGLQKFVKDNEENLDLSSEQKNKIASLLPRSDDRSDATIKKTAESLISIFPIDETTSVETNPEDIVSADNEE